MNIRKNFILLLGVALAFTVIITDANAQKFEGIATYKSDRDISGMEFQGEGMTPDMMESLKAQLKKQMQREYELKFTLSESTWAEVESLDGGGMATAAAGGMVMKFSDGGGITYKNTEDKTSLRQADMFGKQFLISDALEVREWEITGKTKKIGQYEAYEAVYEDIREVNSISMSDHEKTEETRMDTTSVAVWYTPQIPVPHGPEEHWGLPGLILEAKSGNTTYLCTKVVLNPEKGVAIEIPTKGKKVTEDEMEKISQEKVQEMMKKYSGGGDGEENTFSIQISR